MSEVNEVASDYKNIRIHKDLLKAVQPLLDRDLRNRTASLYISQIIRDYIAAHKPVLVKKAHSEA